MGLQSHAISTLEDAGLADRDGVQSVVTAYFIDSDIMAVEVSTPEGKQAVLDALSYDFRPEVLDDLGPDGMVIKFLPLLEYL